MNPNNLVESTRNMRMNVEGDRLSSLPDDIIHKILSFMNIKDLIGTSVLSSRWRFIWTSMPYLNFSTEDDYRTLPEFSKFVTRVLLERNNLIDVYSVNLNFRGKLSQVFVKRILNYAFRHNVQQMNVVFLLDRCYAYPLSLFSSQSLKHLSLTTKLDRTRCHPVDSFLTSTWELPALTTLDLHSVTLRDDNADKGISIFSKCANLKNLTLENFNIIGSNGALSILHPQLSNLTLVSCPSSVTLVNVAAPQLQNLTIKYSYVKHVVSAPNLASLLYKGSHPLNLTTEGFHCLEKANICVSSPKDAHAHQIVLLLQQLHTVKFLELNMEIVQILSSSKDLIVHQLSPFVNLKSLRIWPETVHRLNQAPKSVAISTTLKSYLLDSSPGAAFNFTMFIREETEAQKLMVELQVLLKEERDKSKTKRVESHEPKKLEIRGYIAQMKRGCENLSAQIEKAHVIYSKLRHIQELLTSLPVSNRAKIQPCFHSLRVEADIALRYIADCIRIQCEENQSRSSVGFHELATTLGSSSSLQIVPSFFLSITTQELNPIGKRIQI